MTPNEKRRAKYPDTSTFHFHNANPKGRLTSDCVIRAICTVLDVPYSKIVMDLAQMQCELGYDDGDTKLYDKYMQKQGWVKVKQPRKDDNTKFTGVEFCRTLEHPIYSEELNLPYCERARILAHIGTHHIVAIVEGQVWDTWDSTDGAIGKLWVKPC